MSHQRETVQRYCLHKTVDILLLGFYGVIAVPRPVAIAVAPLVQDNKMKLFGEGQADEVPAMGLLAIAVEHQDGRVGRIAPFQIVKVHPINLNRLVNRLIFLGKRHSHLSCRIVKGQAQGMRRH